MSRCCASHTSYQPDTWKCPECGAGVGEFVIDEPVDNADENCELLHSGDYIKCYKCGYECNGTTYARRMKKVEGQIKCPHCKGTGWIKKEE